MARHIKLCDSKGIVPAPYALLRQRNEIEATHYNLGSFYGAIMSDMLAESVETRTLHLRNNRLTDEAVVKLLKQNSSSLISLDLSQNPKIWTLSYGCIGEILDDQYRVLTHLNLEGNNMGDENFIEIAKYSKFSQTLKVLRVCKN